MALRLAWMIVLAACAGLSTSALAQSYPRFPTVCVQPGGPPPCKDSSGDGLCDSWKRAGRIPDGALLPDADLERPNIYVHYDYMGWGTPGAACTQDSSSTLDTISESALDKLAGVSPLSAGLRDIVTFSTWSGSNGFGPASGPIDWDGSGLPGMLCTADSQCGGGGSLTGRCLASGICAVKVDLNKNQVMETLKGYNDWDHGSCTTSADCPINGIRATIHDTVDPSLDPHEPCVRNRCQTLWYPFQCTQWGRD